MHPAVFEQIAFDGYELVDSGGGEKLERFGDVVLRRPDPQALWSARGDRALWSSADLCFERDPDSGGKRGRWIASPRARASLREREPRWELDALGARCVVRPTPFKHVGLFPEQAVNWRWIDGLRARLGETPRLLNLFGYTGVASVLAARSGYRVTHVDASKTSIAWARENARASGLADDAVRWLVDDARAFAERELRRDQRYDAILLDPPHHGRGPKGEVWQFEEHLSSLVATCARLLAPRAALVLSAYAIGTTPLALANVLGALGEGSVEAGELALVERASDELSAPRRLPCGFCARFERGATG